MDTTKSQPADRAIPVPCSTTVIVGSPETVQRGLKDFAARTGADEIIATANMFDHAARVRSYEIAAAARDGLEKAA